MLILNRRVTERIECRTASGELIVIVLKQIKGKTARIGVEADRTTRVLREELLEREEVA